MNKEIEWEPRKRPRKKYNGHDIRRTGEAMDERRRPGRSYVECECGKVYSGWGEHAFYTWERHRQEATG